MKLVVEVEVQTYSSDEEAQILEEIKEAVLRVVALCQLSVGTFVRTEIQDESQVSSRS